MTQQPRPLYQVFSRLISACEHYANSGDPVWLTRHRWSILKLLNFLPSGAGVNNNTRLSDESTPEKIMLTFSYSRKDANGLSVKDAEYTATITPSLQHLIMCSIDDGSGTGVTAGAPWNVCRSALLTPVWQDQYGEWHSSRHEPTPETIAPATK